MSLKKFIPKNLVQTRPMPFHASSLPVMDVSRVAKTITKRPNQVARVGQDSVDTNAQAEMAATIAAYAVVGGVIGYAFSPEDSKLPATAVGALATGAFGLLGLLGTTGYLWWLNSQQKPKARG